MIHGYPVVGRRNVELNFRLNCGVITLMTPFLFPRTVICNVPLLQARISRSLWSSR